MILKDVWDGFWVAIDGHKTDLLVVAGVVLWGGWVAGWWSYEQIEELVPIVGLLTAGALRDGMRK